MQIDQATHVWLLVTSWIMFVVSIIITLVSFQLSQCGIKKQLEIAADYYLRGNEDAIERKNSYAVLTDRAGYVATFTFVFAVIAFTIFISVNLIGKEDSVADEKTQRVEIQEDVAAGAPIPQMQRRVMEEGAKIPALQPLTPGKKGAPIPTLQPMPQSTPSSTPSGGKEGGGGKSGAQSDGTSSSGGGDKK